MGIILVYAPLMVGVRPIILMGLALEFIGKYPHITDNCIKLSARQSAESE